MKIIVAACSAMAMFFFFADSARAAAYGSGTIMVEGEITDVSELPGSGALANLPDCTFAVRVKLSDFSIKKDDDEREVVAFLPGIAGGRLCEETLLTRGDKLRLVLVPFRKTPESMSRQFHDTLGDFAVPRYSAVRVTKIAEFATSGFVEKNSGGLKKLYGPPLNPPQSEESREARQAAIDRELQRVLDRIAGFLPQEDALAAAVPEMIQKAGLSESKIDFEGNIFYWFKRGRGYFNYPLKPHRLFRRHGYTDEVIEGIRELNSFFAYHNVDMIVVLMPNGYDIAARMLLPEGRKYPCVGDLDFARALLESGVEVIELSDSVLKAAEDYPMMSTYDRLMDCQPGCGVVSTAAREIAGRLKRYSFKKQVSPANFSVRMFPSGISVDGVPEKKLGNQIAPMVMLPACDFNRETRFNEALLNLRSSPVYLAGSVTTASAPYKFALPIELARACGVFAYTDVFARRGVSSELPAVFAAGADKKLKGRKVALLALSTEETVFARWESVASLCEQSSVMRNAMLVKALMPRHVVQSLNTRVIMNDYHSNYIRLVPDNAKAAWTSGVRNRVYKCFLRLPAQTVPGDVVILDVYSEFPLEFTISGETRTITGSRQQLIFPIRELPPRNRLLMTMTPRSNVAVVGFFGVGIYKAGE